MPCCLCSALRRLYGTLALLLAWGRLLTSSFGSFWAIAQFHQNHDEHGCNNRYSEGEGYCD